MSAIISACGKYRYRLERETGAEGPVVAFFGVNPSTADASVDDATIRKMVGFAQRWGCSRILVGNVFAYRATDVRELRHQDDPFGPEWPQHIASIIADANILVPCWGKLSKLPPDLRGAPRQLLASLRKSEKPVYHLGLTASGDPKHPLMLGYDTRLIEMVASR